MVCLRNICINTLQKGAKDEDDDDDDDNDNNNNNNNNITIPQQAISETQRFRTSQIKRVSQRPSSSVC
jgi:hypothetical protein